MHHFNDELSPITILPPLTIGSSINQPMEDIDEGIEEGSKGEHIAERKGSSRSHLEVVGVTPGTELALFAKQYNENLFKEFYANLTEEFGNPESPAYGQVYVRGNVINFSPTNIAHYLSCPHFSEIEGTGLEEEADFHEATKVLIGDAGAVWPETNRLNSNLIKIPHRALLKVFCGNWLPTTNIIVVLKERAHLLYAFSTRKMINICIVIFRNILRQIDQKKASKIALPCLFLISEYLLGCRDLSLPSDSWVRALDPLVMPKIIVPSVVPPSPTLSTQEHTRPGKSTRQQSS
ncbi:hypothetical protein M9H77_08326 [Catharanthus roseus]|uniref:Uncharacterized protein n=1 Tax=Catharanthus roseus TaxID=4058 RepID=A0ACC0BXM3_CATRO|nr:hypothetical protein M9H77_08326 [Catharanthus roseus]